jgi:hypothetical protein
MIFPICVGVHILLTPTRMRAMHAWGVMGACVPTFSHKQWQLRKPSIDMLASTIHVGAPY